MIQHLQALPNARLIDIHNYLLEHPLFLGLKGRGNKVYGIVAEVEDAN